LAWPALREYAGRDARVVPVRDATMPEVVRREVRDSRRLTCAAHRTPRGVLVEPGEHPALRGAIIERAGGGLHHACRSGEADRMVERRRAHQHRLVDLPRLLPSSAPVARTLSDDLVRQMSETARATLGARLIRRRGSRRHGCRARIRPAEKGGRTPGGSGPAPGGGIRASGTTQQFSRLARGVLNSMNPCATSGSQKEV
jgi:hypothetical protein